ncbi:uncharacterized protein LOC105201364 isoform X1 [Solenopsis invicta]|uniref:uncharacterized protein LOC105201364 isoform X1 n=1 Tax=Solenopsis invicta TaxID=13686 RepID=UPI00193EBB93|nr:uncharacterized protein LOC105201364 isoform X1 [Solenopsis invicta]
MTQRNSKSRNFSHCSNMTSNGFRPLIQICACLAFIMIVVPVDQEACDKTKCPGPLAYYNDLNCIPVYEKEDDCCATKYNCDHLKERSPTKCYVNGNGNEYEIGEKLRDGDANPCDIGCTCTAGHDGIASFDCALPHCFFRSITPNCYIKFSLLNCCPEVICRENPEDRAICNVNGEEYRDGERFTVKSEPDLKCVCQPGYEGRNIEPFCVKPKHSSCNPDIKLFKYWGMLDQHIFNNCTPVYYPTQSPQTSCRVFSRCQNDNDTVIHNVDSSKATDKHFHDEDVCYFGNLIMHRGDELNQNTDYSSECVKCICEVPPVATCQRYEECFVRRQPPFDEIYML